MEPPARIKQRAGRESSSPNQLTTLALLMFSLNENEGVMRNVRLLRDEVDEIVVIDSSPKEGYLELLGQAEEYGVRVCRAIPLGYPEPLVPYGLTKVDSRYVFRLDADEEPSRPLAANLRNFTDCNAWIVPRYELGLRTFTHHVRLFEKSSVKYVGRSYAYPEVRGSLCRLAKEFCIIHHADFSNYLEEKSRGKRYLAIEMFERPPTQSYLLRALTLPMWRGSVGIPLLGKLITDEDKPLSEPIAWMLIYYEFLKNLLLARGYRAARFFKEYAIARNRYFRNLTEGERKVAIAISKKLGRAGIAEFLCLGDPDYVDKLTLSFKWDRDGIDVLRELLRYKFEYENCKEVIGSQ